MLFYSKSEILREAKRRGLEPMVRHVPLPGTDKSPHTTSWATVSAYQLDAARQMLERVGEVASLRQAEPIVAPNATPEMVKDVWDAQS